MLKLLKEVTKYPMPIIKLKKEFSIKCETHAGVCNLFKSINKTSAATRRLKGSLTF